MGFGVEHRGASAEALVPGEEVGAGRAEVSEDVSELQPAQGDARADLTEIGERSPRGDLAFERVEALEGLLALAVEPVGPPQLLRPVRALVEDQIPASRIPSQRACVRSTFQRSGPLAGTRERSLASDPRYSTITGES